jgi:hypothetical protein
LRKKKHFAEGRGTIAAENDATKKQIIAIFGWSTADLAVH